MGTVVFDGSNFTATDPVYPVPGLVMRHCDDAGIETGAVVAETETVAWYGAVTCATPFCANPSAITAAAKSDSPKPFFIRSP